MGGGRVKFFLVPLSDTRVLLKRQNLILVLMKLIVSGYLSSCLTVMREASFLMSFSASGPAPPDVDITNGVNAPLSASLIRCW